MRKIILISVIALITAASVAFAERAPQQTMFPELGTEAIKKMMDDGVNFVLIDARPSEEYAKGHIKGAINIPPEQWQYMADFLPKNKDARLVFYCRGYG